jgi:hypothetical protein
VTVTIKSSRVVGVSLLLTLIAFILLAVYSVNFPDKFVPTIDEWYHYGYILKALNGTLFSFVPIYYWGYMYEGLFIVASGLPPINSYMTTFVLCLLPILSFYLLCSAFWNRNRALVATAIYTLFSGFGGILADYLRLSSGTNAMWLISSAADKTYDISYGAVSFSFYLFPKLIGFSAFFTLIYLLYDRKLPTFGKSVLVSIVFSLGYLTHVVEMVIFLLLLLLLLLICRSDIHESKGLFNGLVLGSIIVAAVDFLAPSKNYGFYYLFTGVFSFTAFTSLGLVVLLYLLSRVRPNISGIGKSLTNVGKVISLPVMAICMYGLALMVVVWLLILPTFSTDYLGGIFVWYLYPVRIGIALFMGVIGGYQLFKREDYKTLKLSLAIILVSVGLERAMSYLTAEGMSQLALFPPSRIVEFAWMGIAITASPVFISIVRSVAGTKRTGQKSGRMSVKRSAAAILVIILVIGTSSTLYNVQIRSSPQITLTNSELQALDFLRNQVPLNVTVLASGYSVNKIADFGGRYPVMYYAPAILGATTFEAFADVMRNNLYELYGHFPISYFWLSNSDQSELQKYANSYFVNHLLNYLPIVYKNDEVTIFKMPLFYPPSCQVGSKLVMSPLIASDPESSFAHEALELINSSYSVESDFNFNSNTTQILSSDLNPYEQGALTHIAPGNLTLRGTIVVLNSLESSNQSFFAELLSLNTQPTTQIADGIYGSAGNVSFPSIQAPIFYSNDSECKAIAFYTKNGSLVSPYAFSKKTNDYQVFYVQIYPYLNSLKQRAGTDGGREMFIKLGKLVDALGLSLPHRDPRSVSLGRAILYGQTTLGGNVSIIGDSFYLPALDPRLVQTVGWKEDVFENGWSVYNSMPGSGNITVSLGAIITASFTASLKGVWQYFKLDMPSVNASEYHYMILRERIDANSYDLGYFGCVIGNNTYTIRGWTSETQPPGHPWKTYVFDLNKAVPEEIGGSSPPEGALTQISWTGYSIGEDGGTAELYVSYVVLASSPIAQVNYGNITASLEIAEGASVLVNSVPTNNRSFPNMRILDLGISGDFNSVITTTEAKLSPPGLGEYSRIEFDKGCSLTLRLANVSQLSLVTLVDGESANITIIGGEIHAAFIPLKEELVVYISNVLLSSVGHTGFEKAFISWPYGIYDTELPMEVNGNTTFRIKIMDQDFSSISELGVKGQYNVLTKQQVTWNEWNIPWLAVVSSPYNILLVAAITAIGVTHHAKRRRKSRSGKGVSSETTSCEKI